MFSTLKFVALCSCVQNAEKAGWVGRTVTNVGAYTAHQFHCVGLTLLKNLRQQLRARPLLPPSSNRVSA